MPASDLSPRRFVIAGLCVLCLVVCCLLAWWQWQRFSMSGNFLNLGYVLQWPLFGLFPVFVFWRMSKLRRQHADNGDAQEREAGAQTPVGGRRAATEPDTDDPELAEYNRYLAELNAGEPNAAEQRRSQ